MEAAIILAVLWALREAHGTFMSHRCDIRDAAREQRLADELGTQRRELLAEIEAVRADHAAQRDAVLAERHALLERIQRPQAEPVPPDDSPAPAKLWVSEDDEINGEHEQLLARAAAIEAELEAQGYALPT